MLPGNILTSKADGLTGQMMYEQQSWTFDRDQSMNSKQSIKTRSTSNIQLCTSGRKNQSKLGLERNGWIVHWWTFVRNGTHLIWRGFTAAYYVGHFCHLPTCAAFKEFAVQHVFSFQAEGGTDQSMDQLVDLGDSLGGTESQGGAEQLAMHCQWQ